MVPGSGPQPAIGMIVGEAPGRDEEAMGQPFVGRAGVLLSAALAALGVPRDNLYITNVVKERPQDESGRTRTPNQTEIEAWRPALDLELVHTTPRHVLLLGNVARRQEKWIAEAMPGIRVYGAWHPAYINYNGGMDSVTYKAWLEQLKPWADAVR